MTRYEGLERPIELNWQGLVDNILRKGTPDRVYHMELFQDVEIADAIAERFDLTKGLDPADPHFADRKYIAIQRFCGFDYVRVPLVDVDWQLHDVLTEDTADLPKAGGQRNYRDEHVGPITTREQFEQYPWPDPSVPSATRRLEWFQENLPEDMCLVSGSISHFCELVCWLMGYETLCYALYEQRDLVAAIAERLIEINDVAMRRYLEFDRLQIMFPSDDMGFKTGLMFSPDDMREFVLTGHKRAAAIAHEAGRPYVLHSCGNLADILDDLIDDVRIDAKHSFEDTIEDVRQVKGTYGRRVALIGGIDVDFLCRADEPAIRARVRETLDTCLPGGGYCLGTGNSVTNYIPLSNYLAMLDEGRLYGT